MLVTSFNACFTAVRGDHHDSAATARLVVTLATDTLLSITALVVGILALTGVISMSPSVACVLTTAGATYLACTVATVLGVMIWGYTMPPEENETTDTKAKPKTD